MKLHDLDGGDENVVVAITEAAEREHFDLVVGEERTETECCTFEIGGRLWKRYVAQVVVPEGKRRTKKATGVTTPIGVAIPVNGDAAGRIHVALPTRISTGGAFSLDAQFDPATSREEVVTDAWNRWLVNISAEMLGALAIHLAHGNSPLAWYVVPVGAATDSTSVSLNEQFESEWRKAIEIFATDETLIGGVPDFGLPRLSYCDCDAEGLLDQVDHFSIAAAPMIPLAVRDDGGRWRAVVESIGVSKAIGLSDVLRACECRVFEHKPAEWFLSVATRCLEFGHTSKLIGARWVPLADGTRTAAHPRNDADELLVLGEPDDELAARHTLCRVVHPLLLEPAYAALLACLAEGMNLVTAVEAVDVLAVFARRYVSSPLEVSRDDLLRIRGLFGAVEEREPKQLGLAVGCALLIETVEYVPDLKGVARPVRSSARPNQVYLPSSIEDEPEGWSRAAGETPGILWASPSYADIFKVSGRRSTGRGPGRLRVAKRFLTLLGAATVPRLERVDTPIGPAFPRLQAAARQRIGGAVGILEGDYISPDLDRVVANLAVTDQRRTRRAGGRHA